MMRRIVRRRVWIGVYVGAAIVSGPAWTSAQGAYRVFPVTSVEHRESVGSVAKDSAGTRVTMAFQDSTVEYLVNEVARQAHLRPVFNTSGVPITTRVKGSVTNVRVTDAFDAILKGTGLVAKLAPDGETVVIRPVSREAGAERGQIGDGVIIGRVTDSASGEGVREVAVSVIGTKIATLTSERGDFVLRAVPIGDQVVAVKVFGYKATSKMVVVHDSVRTVLNFVVVPVATVLSGVVTTATGVQSKMSVGSDITTINVDSVMKTAPITSVTDLLENRVPGLTVVHTSGTPGDPSRLLLRGAASINGSNNPIVIVDGVRVYDSDNLGSVQDQVHPLPTANAGVPRPSPLDQIDPNTIATIEILKGPSASALYGSDAANGVFVITTKHGQSGQLHWSVNASQGVSYIPGSYPTLTYAFGHVVGQAGEISCVGGVAVGSQYSWQQACLIDSVRSFQALNDPRFSPLTSGPRSSASATVSGGAQALTYSFTGSAQNTHGMTKLPSFATQQYTEGVGSTPPSWMAHPDDYVMWNGSGQIQATLSPTASLTVSDMLSSSTQHRTDLGLNAVGDLIAVYVDTTNFANVPSFDGFFTQISQATLTSTTNATLNWRIRPWLPLTVTGGYNRTQETDKRYLPAGLPVAILPEGLDTTGSYSLGTQQSTVATLNANTSIPVRLWRGPALRVSLGTNFVSASTTGQDLSTSQVPVGVSDPTTFPQTTATSVYLSSQSSATYGWFVEPTIQLQSRLFINPGIRLDGGTASGSSAGFSLFPKTNISYIVVDHTAQDDGSRWAQTLSLLRLRGAFGIAGVQPTPGQALRLYSTPNIVSVDGGTLSTTGTAVTTLGNPLLHPERSREMEAGFDAQLFHNRATLTATYYNKLRIDAIESVPVAPSIYGAGQQIALNIGNVRNTGTELSAELRLLESSAVTWSVNGSLSSNENRVLSAVESVDYTCRLYGQGLCIRAGYPLGASFRPRILGYADLNQDGLIEANELFLSDSAVFVGGPDPRYVSSFGTTVTLWHGRLSLAAQGDYQDGLTVNGGSLQNLLPSEANQPGATGLAMAEAIAAGDPLAGLFLNSQVVNTLRLDAVSANVTLPMTMARMLHAQQVTLALQGSNLRLWTNYRSKDPNVNSVVHGFNVTDPGLLPQPRTWQLAMRIVQ